jgi:hypothetical protein
VLVGDESEERPGKVRPRAGESEPEGVEHPQLDAVDDFGWKRLEAQTGREASDCRGEGAVGGSRRG